MNKRIKAAPPGTDAGAGLASSEAGSALVYEGLCTVDACPFPSSPDWHRCFVCQKPEGDHAHVESRARAPGKKREPTNIVFLCRRHHDLVDNTLQAGHAIKAFPDGSLHYLYWTIAPRRDLCDRLIGAGGRRHASRAEESATPRGIPDSTPTSRSGHPPRVIGEGGRRSDGTPAKSACVIAPSSGAATALVAEVGVNTISAPLSPAPLSDHPPIDAEPIVDPFGEIVGKPYLCIDYGPGDHPPQDAQEQPAQPDPGLSSADRDSLAAELPAVSECREILHDLSGFNDEELVTLFQQADERQRDAFLLKCQCVHTYRNRCGDPWLEAAYNLFHVSRPTLYAYSNIWEVILRSENYIVDEMGPLTDSRSLMQFIGRKDPEEGVVALEAALAHVAEYGRPPTVKALAQRLGEEEREAEACVHEWHLMCSKCKAIKEE